MVGVRVRNAAQKASTNQALPRSRAFTLLAVLRHICQILRTAKLLRCFINVFQSTSSVAVVNWCDSRVVRGGECDGWVWDHAHQSVRTRVQTTDRKSVV